MSSTASPAPMAPQATPAASASPASGNGAVVQAGAPQPAPAAAPAPSPQPSGSVFDAPPAPAADTAPTAISGPKPDMRSEVPVDLLFPVDIAGVKVGRLNMRRPRVRDRLAVLHQYPGEANDMLEVRFIANLCSVLPQDIEGLDEADFRKLQEQLTSFTVSAPPTTSKTP